MKKNKYYSFVQNQNETDLYIYGDITSVPYFEGDTSASMIIEELSKIDSDIINVYISSYGGECKEGLSIYQALKRHKAKVVTYCDSFCCSIASVIYMAGDERYISNTGCIMIHNAWTTMQGNANELRKQADVLDTITQCSINAYMEHINITEEELKQLLDEETWLTPQDALRLGFATSIMEEEEEENKIVQSVKQSLMDKILKEKIVEEKIVEVEKVVEVVVEKIVEVEKVATQPNKRVEKFINLFK